MLQVIVQVKLEVARQLRQQQPSTDISRMIEQTVKQLGGRLNPVHLDTTDPLLLPFFQVQVSNPQTADQIVAALSQCEGVEAAYLKPADELP